MKILYDLGFNTSILTVPLEGFSYLGIGIPVFLLHPWKEDSGLEHEEHIFLKIFLITGHAQVLKEKLFIISNLGTSCLDWDQLGAGTMFPLLRGNGEDDGQRRQSEVNSEVNSP